MCDCIVHCIFNKYIFFFSIQSEGYRNRKGYFSLNVQTISSANLKVLNVVSRWPGATHDQTVFRHSLIHDRFLAREFGGYILVGDSGYTNTFFLATPFTGNNRNIHHDVHMQAYQHAIIRTRNVVERQYGVLKRRFPSLAYGLRVCIETAQKLITSACILHNICIDAREAEPPGMEFAALEMERMIADGQFDNDDNAENQLDIRHRQQRLAREEIIDWMRQLN